MSEYFVGTSGASEDPMEPPLPGEPSASGPAPGVAPVVPLAPGESAQVRFGVPFNGVVPLWHEGTAITWHRTLDGTDLSEVLGLGLVHTVTGPSPVPQGWSERVDVGTLVRHEMLEGEGTASENRAPYTLILRPAEPSGKRAVNAGGAGAEIPLSEPLAITEAMGESAADFDITGFSVHVARLMLRAARDHAILLFTLRAPNDPEAHHLLSAPCEVDAEQVMHFHLGTLLDMDTPSWEQAQHNGQMTLLDVDYPYERLLAQGASGPDAPLEVERLIEMAQPVVDAIVAPGFPFALGTSVIVRA